MDDLDVVVAERVELGPRVRDELRAALNAELDGARPEDGRRERGEVAGAAAYVEKGVAGLEVEELERGAVDRRRREVEHALAERHISVGVGLGHAAALTNVEEVAAVGGPEGGDDGGR